MNVIHTITGYDKVTERFSHKFEVPSHRLDEVRRLAHVPRLEEENFGAYPIDQKDARALAKRLELPMDADHCVWFLEPFAETASNPET